jgi:hypothetical protein
VSLVLLFQDDYYARQGVGVEPRLSPEEIEYFRKKLFPEPEVKPVEAPKPVKKKLVKISKADKPQIVAKAKEYDSNLRQLRLNYSLLLSSLIQQGIDAIALWHLLEQKKAQEQRLRDLFLTFLAPKEEDFDLLAFAMADNKSAYIVGADDTERLIFTIAKI